MRWDPFEEMRKMQEEINIMFGNFFARPNYTAVRKGWREPLADIWETENDVVVTIELPGVKKDDINLNIKENTLEVKVQSRQERVDEGDGFSRIERQYMGFYRLLQFPVEVIPEKAKATFENGVLEVRIPKTEKSKQKPVKIPVK